MSFRNFAKYYLRLTGSDEVEEAVRLRIKRYSLNVGLGFENRLILVDEGYISRMSKAVVERVIGELGIISQMGLFAGTREDELVYMYNTPVCNNGNICDAEKCKNLHLINKRMVHSFTIFAFVEEQERTSKPVFRSVLVK